MKNLILATSLLMSMNSFAGIMMGDQAIYQYEDSVAGKKTHYSETKTITTIDLPKQRYVFNRTTIHPQKKARTAHAVGFIQSEARTEKQMATCNGEEFLIPVPGTKKSITVPAGTFEDSCYFQYSMPDGSMMEQYLGNVPFSIIAGIQTFKNGDQKKITLMKFASADMAQPTPKAKKMPENEPLDAPVAVPPASESMMFQH